MVEKRFNFLLLFIIFIMIIIISPNAYAYTYDVTNSITSPRGGNSNGGRYLALEIYNSGSQNVYSVNTRYTGTLSNIEFNLPLPPEADECFTTNMEYTITMEMATSDWRNHFARPYVGADSSSTNWATSNVTFVSQKKIYFKFKIPATESLCYGFVYVRLNSPSVSSTAFTGVTNWNLSKISLTDQYSSSGGGSSGGSSTPPTPTPNPNQNIIDNDNQNTNNIIENNNQNTQDIINNQNQNQEQTNQLLGSCNKNYFDLSSSYLSSSATYTINNSTGTLNVTNSSWKNVRFAIPVSAGTYNFSFNSTLPNNVNVVLYFNTTADYSNSTWLANMTTTNKNITLNSGYLIVNIYDNSNSAINYSISGLKLTNTYTSDYILPNQSVCTSKLDDVNNSLTNDNVDSGTGSDFFNSFDTDDNGGISAIVTKPLMIVNNLLSNNGQCANLTLPEFMGVSTAYLPSGCILWNNATPTMVTLWNIFVCGLGSYFILKDIFRIIENLKNPDNDKVEVMDL